VWQSVPFMFADFCRLRSERKKNGAGVSSDSPDSQATLSGTRAYRGYLLAMTLLPIPLLWKSVAAVQLAYAVLGALFMPFLAVTLLIMNNRRDWVGHTFRNRALTNVMLIGIVVAFAYIGLDTIAAELGLKESTAGGGIG